MTPPKVSFEAEWTAETQIDAIKPVGIDVRNILKPYLGKKTLVTIEVIEPEKKVEVTAKQLTEAMSKAWRESDWGNESKQFLVLTLKELGLEG